MDNTPTSQSQRTAYPTRRITVRDTATGDLGNTVHRSRTRSTGPSTKAASRELAPTVDISSAELGRLADLIGNGKALPERILRILDKARTLQYLPLLGRPYAMNDGNIRQYWIVRPLVHFKTYIRLGLKGGYSGTSVESAVLFYDIHSDSFRVDRSTQFLTTFGLGNSDCKELEVYLRLVTRDRMFNWAQAEAFARRCGFHHHLVTFFEVCRTRKTDVVCLLCDPDSGPVRSIRSESESEK